ncbi:MAG: hypothetical protein AAFW81_09060 [Pseudomonadota bacterium]
MTLFEIAPLAAVAVLVLVMARIAGRGGEPAKNAWFGPAIICVLFLAWSLWAVVREGPLGFWPIHTANAWGNQVWFDLLIAIGVGWFFLAPKAKAAGMNVWLWMGLTLCSGTIGVLAMLSRYLYLAQRN